MIYVPDDSALSMTASRVLMLGLVARWAKLLLDETLEDADADADAADARELKEILGRATVSGDPGSSAPPAPSASAVVDPREEASLNDKISRGFNITEVARNFFFSTSRGESSGLLVDPLPLTPPLPPPPPAMPSACRRDSAQSNLYANMSFTVPTCCYYTREGSERGCVVTM